jgi:hypothetical protein
VADVAISAGAVAPGAVPPASIERPDFQIVPRKGPPIVVTVLSLLIAAIASGALTRAPAR